MVASVGADAIGLNFHPPSPRAVSHEAAPRIVAALPPFVAAVGVFVDPQPDLVAAVLRRVRLDCLQFHGDESAEVCRSFGIPYVKAAGVGEGFQFDALASRYPDAQAFLLDTLDPIVKGGSGRSFDWTTWPRSKKPLILAGGLTPDNVADAVATTRPYAVDVASGVEGPTKGRKDAERVTRFMLAVADA